MSLLRRGGGWVAAWALAGGCAHPSTAALQPVASSLTNGELVVGSAAQVEHRGTQGWDLVVQLDLTWRGQSRVRVDLSRTLVRIDGLRWETCRAPADTAPASLFVALEPGDIQQATLICTDIARPGSAAEIRLHAIGTGGTGVMELVYGGLDGS